MLSGDVVDSKEEKGSPERKPRYVWDPKKLAWVETKEPEIQEPAAAKAAIEPKPEEVLEEATVEAKAEEVTVEAAVEGAPVKGVVVEAVGPQYRGAFVRLLAVIVDGILLMILSIIIGRLSGGQSTLNTVTGAVSTTYASWQTWVFLSVGIVYCVGFWAWRGQTPGKMLLGAKIVKTNGSPIGIGRALLRFAVYSLYLLLWGLIRSSLVVLFLIFIGALLIIGFNRKKRGIHDFIAGTVVINSRPPKPQPVEFEAADADEATETAESTAASEPETDMTDQEK